jgi:hypothetical protein
MNIFNIFHVMPKVASFVHLVINLLQHCRISGTIGEWNGLIWYLWYYRSSNLVRPNRIFVPLILLLLHDMLRLGLQLLLHMLLMRLRLRHLKLRLLLLTSGPSSLSLRLLL